MNRETIPNAPPSASSTSTPRTTHTESPRLMNAALMRISQRFSNNFVENDDTEINKLVRVDGEEDEDENDKIVYESYLNWEAEGGISVNFQSMLQQQSQNLNKEIIELLILWEEEKFDASHRKKRAPPSSPLVQKRDDTGEVIEALVKLDHEFEVIDEWLEKQIELFQDVQSKLSLIEAESGALETNWQNLSEVQAMIETIRQELTIPEDDLKILKHPEWVIEAALRAPDLSRIDDKLEPLKTAILALRRAIDFKGNDTAIANRSHALSPSQWIELSTKMKSIQAQRQVLLNTATAFCDQMSHLLVATLFQAILKHKSLNDPTKPIALTIKSISFSALLKNGLYFSTPACPRVVLDESPVTLPDSIKHRLENVTLNPLMGAQRIYHEALMDFLPFIENLLDMAPAHATAICAAYCQHSRELLYAPLTKRLFKDISTILAPRPPFISLHTLPAPKQGGSETKTEPLSIRLQTKESPVISSWAGLEVLLVLLTPLIRREESFITAFFPSTIAAATSEPTDTSSTSASSVLSNPLGALFESIPTSLAKYISTASDIDGIETLALLYILDKFILDQLSLDPDDLLEQSHQTTTVSIDYATYMEGGPAATTTTKTQEGFLVHMLASLRTQLLQRFETYLISQLEWIHGQFGDPKKSGVFLPFLKLPLLIDQIEEMTGGLSFRCVEDGYKRLCKKLFSWLDTVVATNEKYADAAKIQNFSYFEVAMKGRGIKALESFVAQAVQMKTDALKRYIEWMLVYEIPVLVEIGSKVDLASSKIGRESGGLELYVKRPEALKIAKEMDTKKLEKSIATMYSRLEKHLGQSGLGLMGKIWALLKSNVVSTVIKLRASLMASYQITLNVEPALITQSFDKLLSSQK